jgi:Leu/Phe-tRNA-protein transferase
VPTAHLASLGAFAVDRAEFLTAVQIFRDQPPSSDAFVTPASDAT